MANQISELFQKLMQNPKVLRVAEQMYNSMGQEGQQQILAKPGMDAVGNLMQGENPMGFAQAMAAAGSGGPGGPGGPNLPLGSLAFNAAKAHPFKTAGLVGLGASNIGGLTDNNKFGGQLGGLALGGLGAHALAQGNPYLQAIITMGGGALGSLFDKLRARKEMEQAQGIPNAGNPIAMMQRR